MGIPTVLKQASESRLYIVEFAALMSRGDTIFGVTSVVASPVTLSPLIVSTISFSGTQVQFRLTGGLVGTKYKVTAIVTTVAGDILEGEGLVQLEEI